ncbi:MAG: NmrA/HSCARG family protein, partial [Fibrobacter sp.]|nr:NmrA/HSCARG family protein [Fibrobacter sp.]
MDKKDKIILVTGATGHQGGAVARHLLESGFKVRALTRHPDKPAAVELKNSGAEIFEGDFDDFSSIENAVKDVYGVFSVQQPLEYGVNIEVKQGKAVVDAAKKAGVKHFVYCSYGGAEVQPGVPFIDSKWEIENYIRSSGMNYTIFRPVLFMEFFLMPMVQDAIYNGTLRMALDPEMELQLIAVDDIGAFVDLAFSNPEYYFGKELEIAGDVKTGNQIADVLSRAIGRVVKFEQ